MGAPLSAALDRIEPTIPAGRLDERPPKCFREGPVLQVDYTGVERRCTTRYRTLFNPPLWQAVRDIAADLQRRIDEIEFVHAPPNWRPATITVMSAAEGEGRWPLAFLQLEGGVLMLGDLRKAQAFAGERLAELQTGKAAAYG